jgi:hypothetical protein
MVVLLQLRNSDVALFPFHVGEAFQRVDVFIFGTRPPQL